MTNSSGDGREARRNSVRQLCELYNVVIGVALSLGVYNAFVNSTDGKIFGSVSQTVNFVAFITLIIPFYHGAVRHLYATYVEDGASKKVKSWAVLIDFLILFGEGCLFVFIVSYLKDAEIFFIAVMVLLAVDCIWGIFATLGFAGSSSQEAEKKWAQLNFGTIVVAIILVGFVIQPMHSWGDITSATLAILLLVRTVVDYSRSWKFYFPPIT